MENKRDRKRTYGYVKWVATAAFLAIFISLLVDEWTWARPVLLPFAGIVAAIVMGLWFADAARYARRRLKIVCCTALGLVLLLWVAGTVVSCSYHGRRAYFQLAAGEVELVVLTGSLEGMASPVTVTYIGTPSAWHFGWSRRLTLRERLLCALGLYLPMPSRLNYPSQGRHEWDIFLPLWLPVVIVGLPTAVLLLLNRHRPRLGCCRHCGYDLTANVTGICPECGSPIPKETREALANSSSSTETTP